MPRRGSRAQLIHLLADHEAAIRRDLLGEPRTYAQDFYEGFQTLTTAELQDLASNLAAASRGRRAGTLRLSRYTSLIADVDAILKAGKRKSERGACGYVAAKAGVSAETLRKLRRSVRRPN